MAVQQQQQHRPDAAGSKSKRRRKQTFRAGHEQCTFVAPDSGHSWVVMFSVVTVTVLAPSIVGCFGIILPDVRRTMNTTVSQAALVPTLTQSINFLCTPIAAVLGLRFSFRKVGVVGGVLMSLSICLTFFAKSIEAVYLTFGILGGVGFGLANKSGLFVVNEYFDKRRGLATGTYYAGAAVCRLVFPVIVQSLVHEYSYPGALLVWGAIMANICVSSSLYQPIKWHNKHVSGPGCPFLQTGVPSSDLAQEADCVSDTKSEGRASSPLSDLDLSVNDQNRNIMTKQKSSHDVSDKDESALWLDTTKSTELITAVDETAVFLNGNGNIQDGGEIKQNGGQKIQDGDQEEDNQESKERDGQNRSRGWHRTISAVSITSRILANDDVGEVLKSPVTHRDSAILFDGRKSALCRMLRSCVQGLDFSLFSEPAFYVVCASSICHSFATVNAYVFLPPLGRSVGLGDRGAFLLSSVGIGEIIGRLVIPWMRDLHILRANYAYMMGAAFSSVAAFAITFTNSFGTMVALSILLGIGAGSMVGLGSVLCVEAVGLKRLASAISFQQFFQGVFTLPSGLLLGWIRDVSGSYTQSFYVMAAVYSGSFWIWFGSSIAFAIIGRRKKEGTC